MLHHGQGTVAVLTFYKEGIRGVLVSRPFLEMFIGFYITDEYVCNKVFDVTDEDLQSWKAFCRRESKRGSPASTNFKPDSKAELIQSIEDIPANYVHSDDAGSKVNARERFRTWLLRNNFWIPGIPRNYFRPIFIFK